MPSRKKRPGKLLGRPRLSRDELRRHRVVVHLTDGEMQALDALANSQGADLGAVARELLVKALDRNR